MGIKERKERERERRRQQILVAAKRVFASKGFGRATMEDIAAEAELSPGTLYLYFKSKDELSASLSIRLLEYINLRMEHLANDAHVDAKEKISYLKKALLDIYEFDPLIFKHLSFLKSNDSVQANPELLDAIETLYGDAIGKMTSIFADGISNGTCSQPREMAEILWATFYGVVLWRDHSQAAGQDSVHFEAIVNRAFEIFEHGAMRTEGKHMQASAQNNMTAGNA